MTENSTTAVMTVEELRCRAETSRCTALKIARFGVYDAARSRWIFFYTSALFLMTYGLCQLTGDTARVFLSMTNIALLLVPLISLLFATFYLYSSEDYVRFMLSQPVRRGELFHGLYWGVTTSLLASFLLGAGPPLLLYAEEEHLSAGLLLLGIASVLTCIFTALAFVIGLHIEDKAKGLAAVIGVWLFAAILYDGAVLLAALLFQHYPLETPLTVVCILNPIDLARVLMLLRLDVSALMGYTGASFRVFFGSTVGAGVSVGTLFLWAAVLYYLGIRAFKKKDF